MLKWHLKFQPEILAGAGKAQFFGPPYTLLYFILLYLNQNGPIQYATQLIICLKRQSLHTCQSTNLKAKICRITITNLDLAQTLTSISIKLHELLRGFEEEK